MFFFSSVFPTIKALHSYLRSSRLFAIPSKLSIPSVYENSHSVCLHRCFDRSAQWSHLLVSSLVRLLSDFIWSPYVFFKRSSRFFSSKRWYCIFFSKKFFLFRHSILFSALVMDHFSSVQKYAEEMFLPRLQDFARLLLMLTRIELPASLKSCTNAFSNVLLIFLTSTFKQHNQFTALIRNLVSLWQSLQLLILSPMGI